MKREAAKGNAIRCSMTLMMGLLLFFATGNIVKAQSMMPEDKEITSAEQAEIIDSVCAAMNRIYVFPDVAAKMEKHLRKRYKEKAYDDKKMLDEFAEMLTADLQEISNDKHLWLRAASPEYIARFSGDSLTCPAREELLKISRYENFDFIKAERLSGNVGYLKFNSFRDAGNAGSTAIAALNFLAYVDALIIDLRDNGGGEPSMIQLITSYFFDQPVHLNSFYIRQLDSIQQFWTQSYVEGPRMSNVDLYVLTSNYTFSGAEEFSYNLKNLGRATIIGETTGGGAHPTESHIFANLSIGASIPYGRAINPITGTNWEGVGVKPHIEVPADQAMDVAYLEALKRLKDKTTDEGKAFALQWGIDGLNAKLHPVTTEPEKLKSCVGIYGPRTITYEEGTLYYQREGRSKMILIPMAEDVFTAGDIEYFRLKVIRDQDGKAIALEGMYDNGMVDKSPRSDGK
ncbi:MAG: S41 family peptidase [Candidatus Zixiibacteriota bacterium]